MHLSSDNAGLVGGADDPNVCVLRVQPVTAKLWDGPESVVVAAFELAKPRLTGEKRTWARSARSP
jgi:Pyridoxamine 5'-phosphate oxidase like